MSNPSGVTPFTDNWAYLKAELAWLDRLLMMAVSRQKREIEDLDDFALSGQDRVTSHWWKGIITFNSPPGYDHARPPKPTQGRSTGYIQQLEARIVASQQQGVVLALPQLRDRLQLSPFEKNVLLMALAPEINHRFGRLYGYLQYHHDESEWDLPTVDLCLRLLCRNDQEWRQARPLIAPSGRLVSLGLVEWASTEDTTLLSRHLRLTEDLTTYLLSESPDPAVASTWAAADPVSLRLELLPEEPSLVLPPAVLSQLDTVYALAQAEAHPVVLLAGAAGTGKTRAARDLATRLNLPMVVLDLGEIATPQYETLFDDLAALPPGLLLVKTAHLWLGRSPILEPGSVQAWISQRRTQPGLTLFTTHHLHTVKLSWRQGMAGVIELPEPTVTARQTLWQQAIPPDLKVSRQVRWPQVAQLPLTGGDIERVAQTAIALAQQTDPPTLTPEALKQSLALHHPTLAWPSKTRSKRKPKS
jgi:hypothetical protein